MKYSVNPSNGPAMTLGDVRTFVQEMTELRGLPDDTAVRAFPVLEVDMAHGPRISRLTADTDTPTG